MSVRACASQCNRQMDIIEFDLFSSTSSSPRLRATWPLRSIDKFLLRFDQRRRRQLHLTIGTRCECNNVRNEQEIFFSAEQTTKCNKLIILCKTYQRFARTPFERFERVTRNGNLDI